MIQKLVPDTFEVPEKFETAEFVFRKLMFADAKLDYEAVMSSIDIIRQTRGGSWPTPELTFEDDQIDLGWHQREFEFKTSFAYTIFNLEDTECLGCLYLYPPGYRNQSSKDADLDVSFWVTQKAYDEGLYDKVYQALDNWLKTSWPFEKIVYTNLQLPKL
jgi:hypothetical protein